MTYTLPSRTASPHMFLYLRLTLTALLWGGTFVAGRMLATEMPPLQAATLRFGVAALVLLVLLWTTEGRLPRLTLRQGGFVAALGLTGVVLYNLFFFAALSEMPASRTALFVAFNPIAVALASGLLAWRFLPLHQCFGICLALMGAVIVISRGDAWAILTDLRQSFGHGELSMLAAVASWVAYTLLGRQVLGEISPLAATTWAALVGFVVLALCQMMFGTAPLTALPSLRTSLAILYLAIGGTVVPFVWYLQGVQELGPERAAIFTNLVPVFGVLLGFLLLNEPVGLAMMLGGGLVIFGVFLTNQRKSRPS